MPSAAVHRAISRALGYNPMVDELIDLPYSWLGGKHRVLFHSPGEAERIGTIVDPRKGALGGWAHRSVDAAASADRNLKEFLEMWARMKKPKPGIRVVMPRFGKYRVVARAVD